MAALKNKTVVITGASAGIGRAMAMEFARRGYHLGLTARRLDVLESLRTDIWAEPASRACASKSPNWTWTRMRPSLPCCTSCLCVLAVLTSSLPMPASTASPGWARGSLPMPAG
ncbi:MAG: SDR family NAD(P)-dependent oxidoreductase [Comamonadaceae bacterium]|nr:SDR family NAD(P)-dependent oxidoreductase [Comamonadaceae bacterium]